MSTIQDSNSFHNSEEASLYVQRMLRDNGIETERSHLKRDVGTHVDLIETKSGITHHIKFSKTPFYAFGHYFPKYKGEFGESLDEDVVNSYGDNDIFYFAQPNGISRVTKVDFVKPRLWRQLRNKKWVCHYSLNDMEALL